MCSLIISSSARLHFSDTGSSHQLPPSDEKGAHFAGLDNVRTETRRSTSNPPTAEMNNHFHDHYRFVNVLLEYAGSRPLRGRRSTAMIRSPSQLKLAHLLVHQKDEACCGTGGRELKAPTWSHRKKKMLLKSEALLTFFPAVNLAAKSWVNAGVCSRGDVQIRPKRIEILFSHSKGQTKLNTCTYFTCICRQCQYGRHEKSLLGSLRVALSLVIPSQKMCLHCAKMPFQIICHVIRCEISSQRVLCESKNSFYFTETRNFCTLGCNYTAWICLKPV